MIAFFNFMENITLLSQNELAKITNHRSGEIKFGEKIITVPKDTDIVDFITNNEAKFVLFGIPEDIGVKANLGRIGAASAYDSALQSLANIQHNKFCKGSNLLTIILSICVFIPPIIAIPIIPIANFNNESKIILLK